MASEFFTELKDFLPKFVPKGPSYIHGLVAFMVAIIIGHLLSTCGFLALDIDGDGVESDTELKMKQIMYYIAATIAGVVLADTVYGISWKLRNKKVNPHHFVYSTWFPSIYS